MIELVDRANIQFVCIQDFQIKIAPKAGWIPTTTNYEFPMTNDQLPMTNDQWPMTNSQFPIPN